MGRVKGIVQILQELGISVLASDLKSPHEEQCKAIYAQILSTLMGVNMTKQVPFHKLSLFAFPSLHESSIVSVRLFRELIKFMQKVGVTDFSLSDLISPESTRTVRNLSAIINFARWRAHAQSEYVEHKHKIEALTQSLSAITERNGRLAQHFVELTKKHQSEVPQVEVPRAEIEQLQSDAQREMKFQEEQAMEIRAIKKEMKRLKTAEHENKMMLQQKVGVVHSLDSKIVRSPQRIKRELRTAADKIQRDKKEIAQSQREQHYDEHKRAQLELLHSAILKRTAQMQEIAVLKNEKQCAVERELKIVQTKKVGIQKELKALHRARKSLSAALTAKKSEYSALQREHNAEKHEIEMKNAQIKGLSEQHSKARIEKQMQIAKIDKQIEAKRDAMRRMADEHRKYLQQIAQRHKLLAENVSNYHQQISEGMRAWDFQ